MRSVLTALLACLVAPTIEAQQIRSTFETGPEGWTAIGASMILQNTGGHPSGFLKVTDQPHFSYLVAPSKFLGDLSRFAGGTLRFDLKEFSRESSEFADSGDVTIISGTNRATATVAFPPFTADWTTYSIALTAAAWNQPEPKWLSMLSNVTEIQVVVDPSMGGSGGTDVTGFDNFTISTKGPRLAIRPLPASQMEVCWDTAPNTWYLLQVSPSPSSGQWLALTGTWVPGDGTPYCTIDTGLLAVPHKFYRVVTTNSPP